MASSRRPQRDTTRLPQRPSIRPARNSGHARRDGLSRRARHPNYWAYARNFVLAGPHVRAERLLEPARAPLHGLGLVGHVHRSGDPMSCTNCTARSPRAVRCPDWSRRSRRRRPNYAWTDLTYLLHKHHVSWALLRLRRDAARLRRRRRRSCPPLQQRSARRASGTRCPTSTRCSRTSSSATSRQLANFYTAARPGTLPAVSWVMPNGADSEHPPALVSAGQAYVTGLDQRRHAGPGLEAARRSSWPGTTGAASTTTWPRPRSTRTATACACRPGDQPLRQQGLHRPPDALSFDAYLKFIEDDFLGGQRLDPEDRRAARPAARRARERARSWAT